MGIGCQSCGGRTYNPRALRPQTTTQPRRGTPPTAAVAAATASKYEVVSRRGTVVRSFTSEVSARRHAEMTGGTVRPVKD